MLYDSPLHRAGYLQVFVHTEKDVLIEVNQETLIPRTFKGFAPLIVKLLNEGEVRSKEDPSLKLLSVIKNPISDHLPVGCKRYALSAAGKPLARLDCISTEMASSNFSIQLRRTIASRLLFSVSWKIRLSSAWAQRMLMMMMVMDEDARGEGPETGMCTCVWMVYTVSS